MIKCKYGYFSNDGKEFIITDPFTPRPWINVISNGDYSIITSQMGGGFSFRDNAEQNRLTRLYQDLVKDNWGKYFYVRDKRDNKYFSTTCKPMMKGFDSYEVHIGIGYTKYVRVENNLKTEMTMYVSSDSPMEYITLNITNLENVDRNLDVTSYFEWAPGLAYDNHREFHKLFTSIDIDKKLNAMIVKKILYGFADEKGRFNNDNWPYTGFLACSEPIASYDGDKESFLGMYNDETCADAMKNADLGNSKGRFCDPVGALRVNVSLKAKASKTIVFTLGMAKDEVEDYQALINKTNIDDARNELLKVHQFWHNLIDKDIVETPDDEFNFFTNTWSKYQTMSCRLWAKAAYYQISGGIGFRDQLQDSLIFLQSNPELTKKQIMLHACHQFYHGDVYHWWLTINPWGPRGNCSDDFLWLPFAVIAYINETNDYEILNEKTHYVDNGEKESIYEHIKKAIYRSIELTSKRGVPLMGDHDWNDGLSAVGHDLKGESFWVSEFLYYILDRMDNLINYEKDNDFLKVVHDKKELTRKTLNEYGWEDDRFLQATNDYGELIGSKTSKQGQIFLNPQIWSVIADCTSQERKEKAMANVEKYLLKDYGSLLLYPAYDAPNREIGYVTRYAPGLRENGGVYTHAATWTCWAYALMGNNELAYQSYIRINPIHRCKDIERFKSEPYVTPGNSDGPISPYFGKGGWSWYSGSSQWMHNVAITSILGIKGHGDKLEILPCIPNSWPGYKYTRMFNKKIINIEVIRGSKESLLVNGKKIEGNMVNLNDDDISVFNITYTLAK